MIRRDPRPALALAVAAVDTVAWLLLAALVALVADESTVTVAAPLEDPWDAALRAMTEVEE